MTANGSSPISSLVPIYNPPKAITLALADGTLVPVLPPAKLVPVVTPSNSIEIPTTTPPQEEFLSTETIIASLHFGNSTSFHVSSESVLITEIGRGDPLCLLDRISLPQN